MSLSWMVLPVKPVFTKRFLCRTQDENHPTVKPDGYVDNLAAAVDLILKYN